MMNVFCWKILVIFSSTKCNRTLNLDDATKCCLKNYRLHFTVSNFIVQFPKNFYSGFQLNSPNGNKTLHQLHPFGTFSVKCVKKQNVLGLGMTKY